MLTYYVLTHYTREEAADLLIYIHRLYNFLIFAGGLLVWVLIYRRILAMNYERTRVHIFMSIAGIAGFSSIIFGSRLVRIFYEPFDSWSFSLFCKKFWAGGVFSRGTETFHGSLYLLLITTIIILFISNKTGFLKFNYSEIIDMGAMYMPLHILFGRTGCFLAGCCWGGEGRITICGEIYAFNHPAPFYEMVYGLVFFFLLRYIYNKIYSSHKKHIYGGLITALAAISYGVFRFFVEFVRKEPVVGLGLTQAQFAMIIQTAFGAGVLSWVGWKILSRRD